MKRLLAALAAFLIAFPALAQQTTVIQPAGGGTTFPVPNLTVSASGSAVGNGFYNSGAGNQVNLSLGGAAQNCVFTTGGLNNCVINPVNVQPVNASNVTFSGSIKSASTGGLFWTASNPTVGTGGFGGTAPTVTSSTGSAAFSLVVTASPTSGTATVTFAGSAAAHGYACSANDITTPASFVIGQVGPAATSTAIFQVYSRTTGLATTITAADVVVFLCNAY